MSVEASCAECKAKMAAGILEHLASCSANLYKTVNLTHDQ